MIPGAARAERQDGSQRIRRGAAPPPGPAPPSLMNLAEPAMRPERYCALIDEGLALVRERVDARGDGRMRRYQLLSAINAVHASTSHARDTDWARIVALYDALERVDPSPVVTLNKAIAVSEYDSPQVALAMVERLGGALDRHHGFHTARAELLARVGRSDDALVAYDRAITLAANSAEVAHLIRRRNDLRHRTEGETP